MKLSCPHCVKEFDLHRTVQSLDEWAALHVDECRRRKFLRSACSSFQLAGTVMVRRFKYGEFLGGQVSSNIITTVGKELAIDRLQNTSVPANFQAIGTGANAAAVGDVALQTEVARQQGVLSQPAATRDQLTTIFLAGVGTGTITEGGRFNAGSGGILMARSLFSEVQEKDAETALEVIHYIDVV